MNEGSGEWWLYGEDARFYYHFTGQGGDAYAKMRRSSVATCNNFNPKDYFDLVQRCGYWRQR